MLAEQQHQHRKEHCDLISLCIQACRIVDPRHVVRAYTCRRTNTYADTGKNTYTVNVDYNHTVLLIGGLVE